MDESQEQSQNVQLLVLVLLGVDTTVVTDTAECSSEDPGFTHTCECIVEMLPVLIPVLESLGVGDDHGGD